MEEIVKKSILIINKVPLFEDTVMYQNVILYKLWRYYQKIKRYRVNCELYCIENDKYIFYVIFSNNIDNQTLKTYIIKS